MELEVKIKATAKEVYDELVNAILADVKNSTGKDVSLEDLGGNYSYKKILKNYSGYDINVSVDIEKLVYPTEYCAIITSPKGTNKTEYTLVQEGETVNIVYKENSTSNGLFSKLNQTVMELLFSRSNKKKMIRNFSALEKQILDKRAV